MKFPIINSSNDESVWGAWCVQKLYGGGSKDDLWDALKVVSDMADLWVGMSRGSNSFVRDPNLIDAINKSIKAVGKTWDDVIQVNLTYSSVLVYFDDPYCSFYLKPVENNVEITLSPLTI